MTAGLQPEAGGSRLHSWALYAVTAVLLTATAAAIVSRVVAPADVSAIWFSAALACALQLIAFAGLLWVRNQAQLFLAGWLIGMALRFGALGGVAWWLSRSAALPRAAALLSLVGFVFLLLLLEPVFLRWDLRKP